MGRASPNSPTASQKFVTVDDDVKVITSTASARLRSASASMRSDPAHRLDVDIVGCSPEAPGGFGELMLVQDVFARLIPVAVALTLAAATTMAAVPGRAGAAPAVRSSTTDRELAHALAIAGFKVPQWENNEDGSMTGGMVSKFICTCPATRSTMAWPLPL